jgi:hypothetical protein
MWEDHAGQGTGERERGDIYQLAVIEFVSCLIDIKGDKAHNPQNEQMVWRVE